MKRGLLFLLVISMIFFVGCSYISGLKSKFGGQERYVPRGIGLSFDDKFPPAKIIENTEFFVPVTVINYNMGDTEVAVTLSDSLSDSFGGAGSDVSERKSLLGSGPGLSPTGFDKQQFLFGPFEYNNLEDWQTAVFTADASFDYNYESIAELCIKGFNARPNDCPDGGRPISGAMLGLDAMRSAVAVISVKPSSYAGADGSVTVPLEITIANVGNGFLEGDVVEDVTVELRDFDVRCDKRDLEFRRDIKERTITCTARGNVESGFIKQPLVISYKYAYRTIAYSGSVKLIRQGGD